MGKKAVNLLVYTVLVIFMFINILFTFLAMKGGNINPNDNGFLALVSLGMPGLLFVNVLFVGYWILRRRWWFIFPLIALGANYEYYPRMFQLPGKDARAMVPTDAKTLRIATYNINYFSFDPEYQIAVRQVAAFLRGNDVEVVCFQEFAENPHFTPDSLSVLFQMPYYTLGHNSVDYKDLAIFSKYPLSGSHTMKFPGMPSSAMWTDMDVDGFKLRLMTAHMQTTSINQEKDDLDRQIALGSTVDQARAAIRISNIMKHNFRRRASQAEHITAVMDTTAMPLIFCADVNDTPSSFVYNTLMGNGARVDGFKQAGKGYGYTFHNMKKLLRIDYILHTPQLQTIEYYSPYEYFSDHNPVISEIVLK